VQDDILDGLKHNSNVACVCGACGVGVHRLSVALIQLYESICDKLHCSLEITFRAWEVRETYLIGCNGVGLRQYKQVSLDQGQGREER
jgi:hypothetical protein